MVDGTLRDGDAELIAIAREMVEINARAAARGFNNHGPGSDVVHASAVAALFRLLDSRDAPLREARAEERKAIVAMLQGLLRTCREINQRSILSVAIGRIERGEHESKR